MSDDEKQPFLLGVGVAIGGAMLLVLLAILAMLVVLVAQ
jgi:hypothetical protein